ncbi:MAG: 16S rRNA (guanine(527)-N(7))-methyltransferase RsmG [Myxococcota bacterium]
MKVLGGDPALERFIEELAAWGSRTNLVGSTDREVLRGHVREALAAARALPRGCRVVDLGSGGGLPGVPIAIARADVDVTLVEIRERRVHFLRHVARSLPVRCTILRQRIEERDADQVFDVVLMRAVAPLPASLQLGRPWCAPSGALWIWTRETREALEERGVRDSSEISLGRRGRVLQISARSLSNRGG